MSKNINLRDYVYAAMFTAVISVLSFVRIPLDPVPVTGQTLGIMLAGSILTARQAALSIIAYLLLGVAGAPVFSSGSGISAFAGPGGGYLIGFLAGAVVISLLKGSRNNPVRLCLSNMIGGIIVIYIFGITWYIIVTGNGLYPAIIANLRYIPGDLAKVLVATFAAVAVNKQIKSQGA